MKNKIAQTIIIILMICVLGFMGGYVQGIYARSIEAEKGLRQFYQNDMQGIIMSIMGLIVLMISILLIKLYSLLSK